jgi:hypothetical protein
VKFFNPPVYFVIKIILLCRESPFCHY